jgi:U3 small nucleolar RNA-associated protein 7
MIALDPEFLGRFAPQSKLTEGIDPDAVPFARQPRLNRLRIQGKADETEDVSEDESVAERPVDTSNPGREKRKMRGRGKSLKRCVCCLSATRNNPHSLGFAPDPCGNREKMSLTPEP